MDRMTVMLERDHLAFVVVKFDIERNMQRVLLTLLSRGRRSLADGQRIVFCFRILVVAYGDNGRARLAVPEAEMR